MAIISRCEALSTPSSTNDVLVPDVINNVENVSFRPLGGGRFAVTVVGRRVT